MKPVKMRHLQKNPGQTKSLPIALSGASGRMGQAVQSLINKKNSGFTLVEKWPQTKNLLLKPGEIKQALDQWDSQKIQGLLDFSAPALFSPVLKWCVKNQIPFVSGTTALKPAQKKALKTAGQKIPVFYEENMSWGIFQIKKWLESLSKVPYEIVLTDIHHKHKKDRPSGTALKLKNHFPSWVQKKLEIKSQRVGDVFGTHRIVFKGKEEWVSLEHKALSRKLFAGGGLKALKWLVKQPPGLYSFEDLHKDQ